MRVREWYGWHFPEMAKILEDNLYYAKCVVRMGDRVNCKSCDFSDIVEDSSTVAALKASAESSMGTEVTEGDVSSIKALATQVVSMTEYRLQLAEYLRSRMEAIAPNLTVRVLREKGGQKKRKKKEKKNKRTKKRREDQKCSDHL